MTAERRRDTPDLPDHIVNIYMIGVCGTGMGSLASMLQESGYNVVGSDTNAYPPMSDYLAERGIDILAGWDGDNIRNALPRPDLVVVGNVCRRDNPEVLATAEEGIAALSFPEVLRVLFLDKKDERIVVSGTHGKTTTSSMIAWLLEDAGRAPAFMIGGITGNFGSNFKLDRGPFIVEGDEYDSAWFDKVPKFWHYEPSTLVVNNIEYDHADIYPSLEDILHVFRRLVAEMPADGAIWANLDDENVRAVTATTSARLRGFQVTSPAAAHPSTELVADRVEMVVGGGARFTIYQRGEEGFGHLIDIESPVPGMHNVHNVLAAFGVCLSLGLEPQTVAQGLLGFKAVARRQELIGIAGGVTVYDDFAHHPTAVRETAKAISLRHPGAKLWGLFEAKSNTSRRAVFQNDYVDALAVCDEVVLTAPWRKDNLPPEMLIDLDRLVQDINDKGTRARLLPSVDDIVTTVVSEVAPGDIVLAMSGSAFGNVQRRIHAALTDAN